jgi:hypothetical protein
MVMEGDAKLRSCRYRSPFSRRSTKHLLVHSVLLGRTNAIAKVSIRRKLYQIGERRQDA